MLFDKTKPMDLGDIFSNTFKLLRETTSRNIIIAAAFLIPSGIVLAYGLDSFFSAMMEISRSSYKNVEKFSPLPDFSIIFENMGIYFLAISVFLLGYLCAMIGITKICWDSINGIRTSIGEAFQKIFSFTFLKCVGQAAILTLASAGCYSVGIVLIIIGSVSSIVFLIIIGIFSLIGGIILLIYLIFRWYFAFTSIVCEDNRVIESFSKSSFLVSGNWWRVFAIIILASIIIDFAISILTTPVAFIILWDFISEYFKLIASGAFIENDPEFIFNMMKSFGFAFGIIIIVSTLLDALITPLFNVVFYSDLKIRKNDFADNIATETLTDSGPAFDQ